MSSWEEEEEGEGVEVVVVRGGASVVSPTSPSQNATEEENEQQIMPTVTPTVTSASPAAVSQDEEQQKQSSVVTIFTIWNTMIGSSMLTMPWLINQAGVGPSVFFFLAVGAIAFYTAYLVVQSPKGLELGVELADFSDVCRYFWGRKGEIVAVSFSVIVLLGGVIVYWVLMSNFLFYTVSDLYEVVRPNSSNWLVMENVSWTCDVYCHENASGHPPHSSKNHSPVPSEIFKELTLFDDNSAKNATSKWNFYEIWTLDGSAPLILVLLALPLLNFESPTFFTKFNLLGTLSISYLICLVIVKAFKCGIHVDFNLISWNSFPLIPDQITLASWHFPALTGTLAISFFIHNALLNILRVQRNPENNVRDLAIAYTLVASTYVFIAFLFYAMFPLAKNCISDNFLNNFGNGDAMSAVARLFLLVQMMAVLPLLMFLIRAQLSYALIGRFYPGLFWVVILNLVVLGIGVLFAVFYPSVGNIIRFVGAFSGLIYMFILPCTVHMQKLAHTGRVNKSQLIIHSTIVLLGFVNFFAQFALLM